METHPKQSHTLIKVIEINLLLALPFFLSDTFLETIVIKGLIKINSLFTLMLCLLLLIHWLHLLLPIQCIVFHIAFFWEHLRLLAWYVTEFWQLKTQRKWCMCLNCTHCSLELVKHTVHFKGISLFKQFKRSSHNSKRIETMNSLNRFSHFGVIPLGALYFLPDLIGIQVHYFLRVKWISLPQIRMISESVIHDVINIQYNILVI